MRDADAGVANGEMKQPFFGMTKEFGIGFLAWFNMAWAAGGGGHLNDDFALVGEFNGVADQIDEYLAKTSHVTDQNFGNGIINCIGQVELFFGGLGRE